MGSSTAEAFGSVGRGDLLRFHPESLVLIKDKAHPLYDPRVDLPVDERLVLSIMQNGVIEPIIVRKAGDGENGPIVEVVDGRQRVKAAIEANARLAVEGKEEILVPAVRRRGEDADLFGVMASTFIRRGEGAIEQAKKISRYLAMGRTEDDAAAAFGVSRTTIQGRVILLEAVKEVKAAVQSAAVPIEEAIRIARLPKEGQLEALREVIAAPTPRAKKEKAEEANPSTRLRMVGRKKLSNLRDNIHVLSTDERPTGIQVLNFILGDTGDSPIDNAWLEPVQVGG
jgi:ParB family chromosome partitioning protein